MATDEELLGRWFSEVTKPQLARYNERMAVASAYRGAPRWDRERKAAVRELETTTAEARNIYELAMNALLTLGEVSEAVDFAMTQFRVGEADEVAPLSPARFDHARELRKELV